MIGPSPLGLNLKQMGISMKKEWVQIKGDPSVRRFLFEQQRNESLFDERIDELHRLVEELIVMRGVFHAKIHYSSNQLTCWLYDDPYRYRVFVMDAVFQPDFLDQFPLSVPVERPLIKAAEIPRILAEFKRLRTTDANVYMRNASINRINGLLGMTFSCDGSHYIDFENFYETVALL